MKNKAGIVLAVALMLCSAPALAAENLDCIANGMTDAQRAEIYADVEADRDLDEAVIAVIGNCSIRHGWSEQARTQAVVHTISSTMRWGLLRQPPLSVAQIRIAEQAFDATFSEAESRANLANGMNEADGRRMDSAFAAAGLPVDQRILGWLGGYMAATQLEKHSRIDFAGA